MFLDDQATRQQKSLTSHLASGTPAPLPVSLALDKYGTMPLNKVFARRWLAEEGFTVNDALADDLKTYGRKFSVTPIAGPSSEKRAAEKGDKLAKKRKSLELIASGSGCFHKGLLLTDCRRNEE